MPIYEFECIKCHRKSRILTMRISEKIDPVCSHCGSTEMNRLMSRFAVPRSEDARLDSLADPSKLVVFQTAPPTPSGDATRPNFIWNQLANALLDFPPAGLGAANVPFHGTLGAFASQVISQQSQAANSADNLKQGQDIVVNALQQRFQQASGVNIDTEMSRLLTLQTAYGANARVMATVKQMIDTLLQM